jgi:hypothetical protein
MACGLLLGAAGAVYDVASSERLTVRTVEVQGNALVGREEIENAAAVLGANLFWVNHQDVESRIAQFPAIERVEVEPVLPDKVEIRVVERQPVAQWRTMGQTYLVDRDGRVLLAVPSDPANCDDSTCLAVSYDNLPIVEQIDGDPVAVGQRVDAHALAASDRLATLLPQYGVQPLAFDWSANTGLEIPTQYGWRVRFDGDRNVEQQLVALVAMRDYLARTGQAAQVIDVRFGDRPYFQ